MLASRSTFAFVAATFTTLSCGAHASSDGATSTAQAPLTTSPRIWSTAGVLSRLKQRAAASDAAWTTLRAHCTALTQGTFNPPSGDAYPDFPNVGQGYEGDG